MCCAPDEQFDACGVLKSNEGRPKFMSKGNPDAPSTWCLAALLKLAGIKESAFRQMRRVGAVDPPLGSRSNATYERGHLDQVHAVLRLAKRCEISRAAACELIAMERATQQPASALSRIRTAARLCFTGRVRRLSSGVYLVFDDSMPSPEKELLESMSKSLRRELAVVRQVERRVTTRPSTIHRIR